MAGPAQTYPHIDTHPGWDLIVHKRYTAQLSAHALTQRWTYTVPAGYYGEVDLLAMAMEKTAAANDGECSVRFDKGGLGNVDMLANLLSLTGGIATRTIPMSFLVEAGDILYGYTLLAATNTIYMTIIANIRLYRL